MRRINVTEVKDAYVSLGWQPRAERYFQWNDEALGLPQACALTAVACAEMSDDAKRADLIYDLQLYPGVQSLVELAYHIDDAGADVLQRILHLEPVYEEGYEAGFDSGRRECTMVSCPHDIPVCLDCLRAWDLGYADGAAAWTAVSEWAEMRQP